MNTFHCVLSESRNNCNSRRWYARTSQKVVRVYLLLYERKNFYNSNTRLWSKLMYFNTLLICKEMLVYTVRHQLVKRNTETTHHRRRCLKQTKRCSDILKQHFCISKSKNSQKRLFKIYLNKKKRNS